MAMKRSKPKAAPVEAVETSPPVEAPAPVVAWPLPPRTDAATWSRADDDAKLAIVHSHFERRRADTIKLYRVEYKAWKAARGER